MKRKGTRAKNKLPPREPAATMVERAADYGADAIRRYLDPPFAMPKPKPPKLRNVIILLEIEPYNDEPECTSLTEGFDDPGQILKTILHHAEHTAQGMGVDFKAEYNVAEQPDA